MIHSYLELYLYWKHNRADICDNNRLQVDTFISRTLSVLKSQHTETKIHGNQAKTCGTETKTHGTETKTHDTETKKTYHWNKNTW